MGETAALRGRAEIHAAMNWSVEEAWISYLPVPERTPKYVLREFESDLLGWYFWWRGRAPSAQYTGRSGVPGNLAGDETDRREEGLSPTRRS